jgi:hypothetical protein
MPPAGLSILKFWNMPSFQVRDSLAGGLYFL